MVSWNVTLFSLLVAASCLEIVLCGVQLVNAALGVFCGDCRKKVGRRGLGLGLERGSAGGLAVPSRPYFRRAPRAEAALTALLAPGRPPDPPRPGNKPLNSLARLRWGVPSTQERFKASRHAGALQGLQTRRASGAPRCGTPARFSGWSLSCEHELESSGRRDRRALCAQELSNTGV